MDISEIRKANLLNLIASKTMNSQKDFANTVGTAPAYLSQIINGTLGKNGKPATVGNALARKIEKVFELDHGYMDSIHHPNSDIENKLEKNINLSEKIYVKGHPVPIISWIQARNLRYTEIIIKDCEITEWLPPNNDSGKNGYGLKIIGNSMSPFFLPDDRIYVNPDIQTFDLKTGDLVIVACVGDSEATFRKLIIEGSSKYVQPLNPDWPEQITKLTDDCQLIGKVVGLYRKIS